MCLPNPDLIYQLLIPRHKASFTGMAMGILQEFMNMASPSPLWLSCYFFVMGIVSEAVDLRFHKYLLF